MIRAVLDTDVIVAALRSPFGGSPEVLRRARVGNLHLLASFNRRDFGAAPARFGVRLSAPAELLRSFQT